MASAEADALAATERAVFEARMRQAENIVALGQISAGIAHDFNNLLQTITLHSEQAQSACSLDVAQRAAQVIQSVSNRGIRLTRRLLDMTRRDAGGSPTAAPPLTQAVAPILSDVAAMLSGGALGAGISLDIAAPATDLPAVRVLAAELEAVLINLLVNARDALPQGGAISITASVISFAAGDHANLGAGRYVRIEVRDTGIGMTAETLARAGEAFFTTKPSGHGTGLGTRYRRMRVCGSVRERTRIRLSHCRRGGRATPSVQGTADNYRRH